MRGLIIALEGLDGTGKSTLARGLAEALGAALLSTPGPLLQEARRAVDTAWTSDPLAAQLFYAAGVLAASGEAARTAAGGRDVVIDRYWISTLVNAPLRGGALDLPEVEAAVHPADLTILAEVPEALRRRRLRDRGTSAHDLATCRPGVAERLRLAYRSALSRPVAGHGVVVPLGWCSEADGVARLVRLVALVRAGHRAEREPRTGDFARAALA